MEEFGWGSIMETDAPSDCTLVRALFTTYDRPDERVLVEHALPLFLKLGHEPGGDGAERQYFLLELDRRLQQMHDRIVVISSTAREEPTQEEVRDGAYQWIWRSIRHLTVGSRGRAVQHSKVWLLHWTSGQTAGAEYLEIVVSSANLTRAALKGQIQAAWRVLIELKPQRSDARLARWGILPDFLGALAASAGDPDRLAPFVELLARGECPQGITFVASVPGAHTRGNLRRTPWGAAGLARIAPAGNGAVSVAILAPYVGSWNTESLGRWCGSFGGASKRLELVWIDKDHPWQKQWLLPKNTLRSLSKAHASIVRLRHESADPDLADYFHAQHHYRDARWSHAKLYYFRRGTSRRLLITSANFSTAAWGVEDAAGKLSIENFELGVCIEQADWPFEQLDEFDSDDEIATIAVSTNRTSPLIAWARAVWDGRSVSIECRCQSLPDLTGEFRAGEAAQSILGWTKVNGLDGLYRAHVQWKGQWISPFVIELACKGERLRVPIFDERKLADRGNTLPPEVDPALVQNLCDQLLFEEYGGRIPLDDPDTDLLGGDADLPDDDDEETPGSASSESYAVPSFVLARRHLEVVDGWSNAVTRLTERQGDEFCREHLRRDGELLAEAFRRQANRNAATANGNRPTAGLGAGLAADEIKIRLKHFPEV